MSSPVGTTNVFVDPDESAKVMAVSLRAHRERMNR